jgi:hypothetical protein
MTADPEKTPSSLEPGKMAMGWLFHVNKSLLVAWPQCWLPATFAVGLSAAAVSLVNIKMAMLVHDPTLIVQVVHPISVHEHAIGIIHEPLRWAEVHLRTVFATVVAWQRCAGWDIGLRVRRRSGSSRHALSIPGSRESAQAHKQRKVSCHVEIPWIPSRDPYWCQSRDSRRLIYPHSHHSHATFCHTQPRRALPTHGKAVGSDDIPRVSPRAHLGLDPRLLHSPPVRDERGLGRRPESREVMWVPILARIRG